MTDGETRRLIIPASVRSLPPPDPLGLPPRAPVAPNVNEAVGSVGPNVPKAGDPSSQEGASGGLGATHAVYDGGNPPPAAQAWAGWPSEWPTPGYSSGRHWQGGGSDIVWAAIDRNASAIADMPPVVTTSGRRRNPQPAWVANPGPKIYTHWQEFLRQAVMSYYATGEAFVVVTGRYADGYPASFMLVDPWNVNVEIDNGVRDYSINGVDANGDVLHIRYASWPGDARGHGPLEVAGERILAVQTLMRYGSEIAANPQPWGILKSKYQLTKAQSDELKLQWISSARSRNGAPAVLGADLDLTLAQVTPKDMTLSELQQFAEARLSVLLGVPPYILGLPSGGDSLTYSNVSQIFEFWYRSSLKATKDYLAQAISVFMLPAGSELELSESSFTQPSALERAQYYELGLRDGWLSIDEVRAAEKLSANGLSALSEDPAPDPATV